MVQRVKVSTISLLLCALLSVTACKKNAQAQAGDLTGQVLFTAIGSYDAQTDSKEKLGASWRRATWVTQVPLRAQRVVAEYDGNARSLAWKLDIVKPQFSARDLAGSGAKQVQTAQGTALRPAPTSPLNEALILTTPDGLRVLTRGYATQKEPELLRAFK